MRYYRIMTDPDVYVRTRADLTNVPGVVEVTKAEAAPYFKACGLAP